MSSGHPDRVPPVDPGWRFVGIGFEGDPVDIGGGIDPWKVEWTSTHGRIVVAHPSYSSERHVMFTYEVAGSDPTIAFAAGEFSNGVWGFFVPTHSPVDLSRLDA